MGRLRRLAVSSAILAAVLGHSRHGYNIVCDGNSLTAGQDDTPDPPGPYPSQLGRMLAASGVSYTIANVGIGGKTTQQLAATAASRVDTKYLGSKLSVCIFQEVTNDIDLNDSDAPTAYANLVAYCSARRAVGWKVIVVTVLPRLNPGVPADFETKRIAVNILIRAGVGIDFDGIIDIGADSRIGQAGQEADGFYYYISGGSDTEVHLLNTGQAIVSAAAMDAMRALYPAHKDISYIPAHAPLLMFAHDPTGARNAGGNPCADGDGIQTLVNSATYGAGDTTQATVSHQFTYSATGWNGGPAISTLGSGHRYMAGARMSLSRCTIILVAQPTAQGIGLDMVTSRLEYLDFNEVGSGTFACVDYYTGATGSIKTAPNGSLVDGAKHVYSRIGDGTNAGLRLFRDGAEVTLTATTAGDAGDIYNVADPFIGSPNSTVFAGKLRRAYVCGITLSAHELQQLERWIGGKDGITVV